MRDDRTEADDIVRGASNRALLDLILPNIRRVARDRGYAIAIHGSLCRDIDLIAIPWREHQIESRDGLVLALTGAIAGVTGRCNRMKDWTEKPHGRSATTILVWCGSTTTDIDLSVIAASTPAGAE